MTDGVRTIEYEKEMGGKIQEVRVESNDGARIRKVRIVFGPHYFVELEERNEGATKFRIGATHHGVWLDASAVNGELEKAIDSLKKQFPAREF